MGITVGVWRGYVFIYEDLVPEVERSLSDTVNRPVELGAVEGVTLSSLRLGPSSLPPTATDQDQATVDAVEVQFNLLQGLWTRRIGLNIKLIRPNLFLDQTQDGKWIEIEPTTRESTGFIKTELDTIRIESARLVLAPFPKRQEENGTDDSDVAANGETPTGAAIPDPTSTDLQEAAPPPIQIEFKDVDGVATFRDDNKHITFEAIALPQKGGKAEIGGEVLLRTQDIKLVVQGGNLDGAELLTLLPVPLSLQAGRIWGNLEIAFHEGELESINGTGRFQDAIATIQGVPNQFNDASGRLRFQGKRIDLEDVEAVYGQIPATASGSIDLEQGYDLTAQVQAVPIGNVLKTFDLNTPVTLAGAFNSQVQLTGALDEPLLTGIAQNVQTVRVDRVDLTSVQANFTVTPQGLTFDRVVATPAAGGQVIGDGQIIFAAQTLAFNAIARNVPGDAIARSYNFNNANVRLGRVSADVRVAGTYSNFQTAIQWRAPEGTYPGQGELLIAGDRIQARNTTLQVAGGTVTARADSIGGRLQAAVNIAGVRLNQFASNLSGLFEGDIQLTGNLFNLSPRTIRATGNVRLTEGLPGLNRPLTAALQWTGDGLQIDRATAPGLDASGFIAARLEGEGAPGIGNLDLDVRLRDYNLAALPVTIPPQVQLVGQANFAGQVTGTLDDLLVAGNLQLEDLQVNELRFEPLLTGEIRYGTQRGLNADLRGDRDRIAVNLDRQNRPVTFALVQGNITAEGTRQGDILQAEVRNFPLQALNFAPAAQQGFGEIGGIVNGNFALNINDLSNPQVVGAVAIANPALGYIDADSFRGRIRYGNGVASVTDGELLLGSSRYLLNLGTNFAVADPTVQGQITIDRGDVQDVLTALQYFDLTDFARGIETPTYNSAADVDTIPVDVSDRSLLYQLRRFSEILALVEQERDRREQTEILPALAKLQGMFTGTIQLDGSVQTGVNVDFNIAGENWNWGEDYQVAQVVANGSFSGGTLTLFPVRLQTGDRFLSFSGQVGGDQQSGQLRAQNIPVEPLQDLINLPVDLIGNLNGSATLAGSLKNPQVVGELSLSDATLNDTPVEQARAIFGYDDARLSFNGRMAVSGPEPLQVVGSIPYPLAFMDTNPDVEGINLLPEINLTPDLSLDIDVRNEGLALVNVLSRRQLLWQGGQGEVDVVVSGTLQRPEVTGTVQLNNASLAAQVLPEPVTEVSGQIRFDTTIIHVEQLQGQFSRGEVAVQGDLPIFDRAANYGGESGSGEPLLVNLDRLVLNYPGPTGEDLYRGKADGRVLITGTALAPLIGGRIVLSNGRVFIPSGTQTVVTAPDDAGTTETSVFSPPRLSNFLLTLGNNLLVTREPVLNFVVRGDLRVNGTFDDLRPEGTVDLLSGQVNLFTTQFNLARGYDSQATFSPSMGLNPYVDVQLTTSVPEVSQNPFQNTTALSQSEIADRPITDFGTLQTVRVQASVRGPADQIFENLELTSSPRRSENEIIALLGGSFVDTLGQGNGVLAIANLASSALLTNIQTFIANTLGLSDFRLFPTTISSSRDRTSSFGIAAELGFDITSDLSVSVLQILTDDSIPTQFNLRYRLSDEFLLRGSTNLSGDSQAVLEFETRF
jgi:translocation and assembly module TamB